MKTLSVQRLLIVVVMLCACFGVVLSAQTTFNAPNGTITFQDVPPPYRPAGCGSNPNYCEAANGYPSTLTVSGLTGTLSNITLTLSNMNIANFMSTIYILQAPNGATFVALGDGQCVGSTGSNQSLTLNDAGPTTLQTGLPNCNALSGPYAPASVSVLGATFPTLGTLPAADFPKIDGSATFAHSNGLFTGLSGTALNGTWSLYVLDATGNSVSGTLGGPSLSPWSITITTNAGAGTATSVSSNLNPSFTGDTVTFTATVTSSSTVTAGTVQFFDGTTALSCAGGNQTVSSGTATCSLSTLTEGAHNISADYTGTGSFGPSNSPTIVQAVNNHSTVQANPPSGTQGFCNNGAVTIPRAGANGSYNLTGAPANPYASEIFVSGITGTIQAVNVLLNGFTSNDPESIGLLLVAPNNNNLQFFSEAGGGSSVSNLSLIISDSATQQLPSTTTVSSGTYKPASYITGQADVYCQSAAGCDGVPVSEPAPASFTKAAPAGTGTLFSQFGGITPDGTWQLFAVDRITGQSASISSWCLNFTVSNGPPTTTAVSATPNPSFTTAPNNTVTITATVTNVNSPNSPVGEGKVTFASGGNNLVCTGGNPAPLSNGVATCVTTSFTTEGSRTVTASYSGSSNFGASNGTYTQVVNNHTTASLSGGVYSFCNAGPFDVPAGGPNNPAGPSGPNPEDIMVAGLPGTINAVTVSLNNYSSNFPSDIEMMLVGPCQTNGCTPSASDGIDFFSRVGGTTAVSGLNFVFSDAAGSNLGSGTLASGTYKPTSLLGTSVYAAPAPVGPYQYAFNQGSFTLGTVFHNDNGNGTWSLYGESTANGAYATITGGNSTPAFCLNFTENAPTITISKTSNNSLRQGDTGDTFTLTATDLGPGPTGDPTGTNPVTVVDTLPASLTATAISGTGWTCVLATLTCTRSDAVAAGVSYDPITVTVNVSATAPTSVTNNASVSGGGATTPGTGFVTVPVAQVADLTIAKSHTGPFGQGDTASANDTYTITVSNASGHGPTINTVTVVDTLPTGLTPSSMTGTGWTCTTSTATCTRSDALASGSSYPPIALVVTIAQNAGASLTNTATVSGGGELNTANDTATDPTTITTLPDLTITKSHTGNFTQGQTGASYTITVGNATGSATTTGTVTVTDTLPTGLSATAIAGTGWSCTPGTLTCTRSDALAGGSSYSVIALTVNVASNAPSSVTNSVTVSGGGESNTSNDTATDPTTIVQVPDLTISKSHTTQFKQGDSGDVYTITVSNAGPGPVVAGNTVTVVDTLPSGLTVATMSGTGWTCNTGTLTCTRADALAVSGSYPAIALTVNVSASAPSSLTNSVTVSGGGELNTANDTATDVTSITQAADLTITKSHTGNFFQGQQNVTYTITVTNSGTGPTDGTQVLVSETVPTGLTFVSMSGTGWTCPGVGQLQSIRPILASTTSSRALSAERNLSAIRAPSPHVSNVYTCSRTDVLPAGQNYSDITFTANVANNAGSSVTNNVAVSGGGQINTTNDTASDPTTIGAGPDLVISKSHTGNFMQGQTGATYSIVVTNSGGSASVGTVTVVDTLPSGLTATAIAGSGWTCTLGTLTCTRSDALAATSSYAAITLTVSVSSTASSPQINSATVSGGGDVNSANNSASDSTTIVPGSDLTIAKSHNVTFFQGLTGATYTITATNSGVGPTVGTVTVTDTLPVGLTATNIAGTGWSCTLSTLTCTRTDALAAASSYSAITLTVNVANNAPSSVTNVATVAGGGESNTSNDTAGDPTTINAGPDLSIAKSHTGSFYQGQTGATYSIAVSNTGGTASYGTVTVTDTLPTGLTATAISGTGWSCTLSTLTCTRTDALNTTSSYPVITLTVNVSVTAPMPNVTNSASVSGGGDVNTANNTSNDLTSIVPGADMTIAKSHSVQFFQGLVGATYTITAHNSGPGQTNGSTVTVTDTLPTGLTATAISGTGWSCTLGTLTCTRSDVLAGGSNYSVITLTVNVATNAPSSVTNSVTIAGGGETNTNNDTASDVTSINAGPDLTIAKVHNGTFRQGDAADTYTLTVSNGGGTASYGTVTVVDTLPASGLTATALSGTGWSCNLGTRTCTRTDALNPAASYPSITLTVSVATNAPTSVTNTAMVSGGGDVVTTNNSASDTTPISQVSDLTITKTHFGSFVQGQTGVYTITVKNIGAGPTVGTVTVKDTLPAGLTAVGMSGSGWTCTTTTATCTRSSVLAVNASYPVITFTVLVGNAAASVTNQASVSGGGEINTSNDTASDPTTIVQTAQVTITTSPANLSILVDGSYVSSPRTFTWYVSDSHTISTVTPQGGLSFQSWSDGGSLSHNITVQPGSSTYTAFFQ